MFFVIIFNLNSYGTGCDSLRKFYLKADVNFYEILSALIKDPLLHQKIKNKKSERERFKDEVGIIVRGMTYMMSKITSKNNGRRSNIIQFYKSHKK